ncbi:MAG TPA: FAD-dependent oxidoreductase [Gemmatimonadaceae bacterium]|nr:FAD-dependent oxidoreductase [Gemmatimonadaceae bacterium]
MIGSGERTGTRDTITYDVIVIGGGQAGLAMGYQLAQRGISFVILEAHERIGDSWRERWDSLRLFTPARYDGLDGMPFPAPAFSFPTKNEMADYLETYARKFQLPVLTGTRVTRVSRNGDGFTVATDQGTVSAKQVVVAMSTFQKPRIPGFAKELAPDIVQLHSFEYRNPSAMREGDVLVVGAGNSGAEIALDLASRHRVWLSGRDVGQIPFRIESRISRLMVPIIFRLVFHRVLTVRTPMGRKARVRMLTTGGPRIRTKREDLTAAGVQQVGRVAGVREGKPVLEDGRVLDVSNIIWCTGFETGFSWLDLDVHGDLEPKHDAGVARDVPGLYFVGLMFLYAGSSTMVHGVSRDASRIADVIKQRALSAKVRERQKALSARGHNSQGARQPEDATVKGR